MNALRHETGGTKASAGTARNGAGCRRAADSDGLAFRRQVMVRGAAVLAMALAAPPGAQAAKLEPLDRYVWTLDRPDFGGLSDLLLSNHGTSMIAVSDEGELFQADVSRGPAGGIADVRMTHADRPLDNFGQPVSGFRQDAEDLTMGQDGMLYISFEGYARVAGFRLPDMTPHPTNRWDQFRAIWGNEGFEGLATLPDGRLMTVIEVSVAGAYRTMVHTDAGWHEGPGLPVADGYQASGLDVGPDGMLYLLERDYSVWGFSTRVRRFSVSGTGFTQTDVLYETPDGGSENFEGISVWPDPAGRTVVSLISDNDFSADRLTVIAEFHLRG